MFPSTVCGQLAYSWEDATAKPQKFMDNVLEGKQNLYCWGAPERQLILCTCQYTVAASELIWRRSTSASVFACNTQMTLLLCEYRVISSSLLGFTANGMLCEQP